MELLQIVKEIKDERENLYKLLKNKYDLTAWQEQVLMDKSDESNITIYDIQERRQGTTTCLLLKVFKNIFIDGKDNNVIIISTTFASSEYAKNMFIEILEKLEVADQIKSRNKYNIKLKNGINIRFTNSNYDNLRGSHQNQEIFVDDFINT